MGQCDLEAKICDDHSRARVVLEPAIRTMDSSLSNPPDYTSSMVLFKKTVLEIHPGILFFWLFQHLCKHFCLSALKWFLLSLIELSILLPTQKIKEIFLK